MGGYTIAWIVIAIAALCGAGVVYWMLRNYDKPLIRNLLIGLLVVFFVVPAPVPNYAEQLAPAFVVCIFEAFFQNDGDPTASLRVLLLSLLVSAVVISLAHYLTSRRSLRSISG